MPLPLLALGLLAGAGGQQWFKDRREAELARNLGGLLGEAPTQAGPQMGPPDASGGMGGVQATPGSGLLADPNDPRKQALFASGVAQIPGQSKMGLDLLNQAFGRAQQGQQFTASQAQQAAQFGQSQERQGSQFDQAHALAVQNAEAMRQQQALQAQQWLESFNASRREANERLRISNAQLGLETKRLELAQQKTSDLPTGYEYVNSATGTVPAPKEQTKPWLDAKNTEGSLETAQQDINKFIDIVAGKERTVNGRKVRTGGSGSEMWGETAAQLSQIRSQIIAHVGKLQELGTMQPGDVERLEKTLPDPTSWKGPLQSNASTVKAYETLRDQFGAKLDKHREVNRWLVPPPPPGTVADTPGATKRAPPPMASGIVNRGGASGSY